MIVPTPTESTISTFVGADSVIMIDSFVSGIVSPCMGMMIGRTVTFGLNSNRPPRASKSSPSVAVPPVDW